MGPDLDLDLDLEPPRPEIIENHRSETIGGIAGGSDPESSPGGAQKPDLGLDLNRCKLERQMNRNTNVASSGVTDAIKVGCKAR